MPIFLSEEEFQSCSHDSFLVAEKADAFIRELLNQLETVKAEADAASITAEQTCSLLEQRYVSLSSEFSSLQSQHSQLSASLDGRVSEVAQLQSQKHQIQLQSVGKDGEIDLLSTEISQLHKSKRQLMELLEQKDIEISEKNATVKNYLDKIVNLTENAASKEARLNELESELARSEAFSSRVSQEKELVERHNSWLNDELKAKVESLIQLRKTHSELEAEMSAKLADMEKRCNETSSSLVWNKDRVKELESKLASLEQELLSSKDVAATAEKHFSAEISTLTKLVELYKESSEEWSKKAGDLDGVIKAMETHFNQVENDHKERLEKEESTRKELEKEAECLKEKLEKCIAELESLKKKKELRPLPLSSFMTESWVDSSEASEMVNEDHMLVPTIPPGVSGTALAASLLRDGWSLAKIYTKYQEAVDALRHEQLGRKQSEAILERVLHEIEEKATIILEEQAEHERMVEAYSALNQKLQQCLADQTTLHRQIQELKADLRRHERDYAAAEKEIMDLQNQVAVLLKECRDVQLRCGSIGQDNSDALMTASAVSLNAEYDSGSVIPERLLAFKDITGLVEQNVQLRRLVRSLSNEIDDRETELKEKYEKELQRHNDEATSKVDAILVRAEEQGRMIESLHTSVAMYKKLYEEEHKFHSSYPEAHEVATEERRRDAKAIGESFHESLRKAQEQALERIKYLEEEVGKSRSEIISIRSERDKLALEAQLAREKLERFMKEFEHQRGELNSVLARNVEFSQLIIVYQQKLRENSESLRVAEDLSRKLTMEISLVKQEKELVLHSEKRASEEIRNLSERLHRLQTSLDTIQSTEEVREEARCVERRKQEQYVKQIEREWAEAKKELHEEREKRENGMNDALKQVEEMRKELVNALNAVAAAEARAVLAEGRCSDLVEKMKSSHLEASEKDMKGALTSSSYNEITLDLHDAKAEIEKLREEAQVNKEHMLQYKSIAQANDAALKEMEVAHNDLKAKAEKVKKLLESELQSLRERVNELEAECSLKSKEVASITAEKEEALAAASSKLLRLKEEYSLKMSQFMAMETQLSDLKDDLERERQKSRAAQANYERQVILQSETIQELTRASEALGKLDGEASDLRKLADMLKTENNELKVKLETEKSVLEVLKNDADRKYNEVNELNKILHSRLEAFHIKLAEKDRHSSGVSGSSPHSSFDEDDGLQNVVKYLRRSKEIAETEISLLKQEKLRLQSQLETALKAAEEAQASLSAERTSSKTLFTEEEFKSLQLQIREISLLRESNLQLREENRHNFEECQKLRESLQTARIESENLEKCLEQSQNEVRAYKEEIERQKMEKEDLAKRVDQLLERYKNFDVEDYHRLQVAVEQMQVNLREKEAQLTEVMKLCSEKQDLITHLEQDLARSRIELNERESRINEILRAEATLRSEVEKQKRMMVQFKKKSENLLKEKEELSKENLVLSKQLDDARQGKKILGDTAGEQTMKEKEKEKDTRIQMLEKTVERLREEHKTEKVRRMKTQKTVMESHDSVLQQRLKLSDELEKHKQALKILTDDVEALKMGKGSQSEGTSEIQFLSGTLLEDLASAYFQAVEKFEQVAQPVIFTEPGSSAAESSSSMDISSQGASSGQAISSIAPSTLLSVHSAANAPAAKTLDEKEKKFILPKANFEARKTGRKLVRPRILKPEDSQVDIETLEVEGSDSSTKPLLHNTVETQGTPMLQAPQTVRKRPSILPSLELRDSHVPGETSSDVTGPTQKKPKNVETPLDGGDGLPSESGEAPPAANLGNPGVLPVTDESMEEVADPPSETKESIDADKDKTEADGKHEQLAIDVKRLEDFQSDRSDIAEENLNKVNEALVSDDALNMETEQDIQQPAIESGSEREEGELLTDIGDPERGGSVPNAMGSPEPGELQSERATSSDNPTGVDDEPLDVATADVGEIDPPQGLDDDKNDEGNVTEDTGESSEKVNDNNEQLAAEPDEVSEAPITPPEMTSTSTTVELGVPRQGGPSVTVETGGGKQASRSSTTINLNERAKERAKERQAAMISSLTSRGRGRSTRGRGGRSARGQSKQS